MKEIISNNASKFADIGLHKSLLKATELFKIAKGFMQNPARNCPNIIRELKCISQASSVKPWVRKETDRWIAEIEKQATS